jgi:hypothetical protein
VRGEKEVRRNGRGLSVCYNTRVPLRCESSAIPLRFTLSSGICTREVKGRKRGGKEVEMVVLLFLSGVTRPNWVAA